MQSKNNKREYVRIIEPSELKLRRIVAGPICPTRPLSNLIDVLSKPFLLHVKSYVEDNLDFLSKRSRENFEDTLLVTFDVVNILTYHILSDWRLWITGLKTTQKVYMQDLTKNLF